MLGDKCHEIPDSNQPNATNEVRIRDRKTDLALRQNATTTLFGIASLDMAQKTITRIISSANKEVAAALEPVTSLLSLAHQALKPGSLAVAKLANDFRIKIRKMSAQKIAEPQARNVLSGTTLNSESLFDSDAVTTITKLQ